MEYIWYICCCKLYRYSHIMSTKNPKKYYKFVNLQRIYYALFYNFMRSAAKKHFVYTLFKHPLELSKFILYNKSSEVRYESKDYCNYE